jgi:hypothetical protein
LRIGDFLASVQRALADRLGPDLDGMRTRQRFGYLQLYRGDPSVHYEVWAQRKTGRVEVGLHFEAADRDRNYAAAALLASRQADVLAAVGPEFELEEWTAQWTRLHCSMQAPSLTADLADAAAQRAAQLITGMDPLLEELGLRNTASDSVSESVVRGRPRAPHGAPLRGRSTAAARRTAKR